MKPNLLARLLFCLVPTCVAFAWDPPVGIPDPVTQFGWEIDRPTPSFPPEWTALVPTAVANYYYVDKSNVLATDTLNPYGSPVLPRRSIPEGLLAAGSFVYIHGGNYTTADDGGGTQSDRFDWHGSGTSGNPIWITGNPTSKPVIESNCHIGAGGNASYIIFENIHVTSATTASAAITIRPLTDGNNADHILIRNILRTGSGASSDTEGIAISYSQGTDPVPNSTVSDIVIYNSEIHSVGAKASSDEAGVLNGFHTNRVWVVDNVIHDVGSDSVAGSHYSNYDTRLTTNYYIGRNTCHSNGENGIDLKNVQGFVISQNTVYGPFTRENGWAIVLHYGANTAFKPRNGVILLNRLYHVTGGIYTGFSSGCDNLDIIGNKIWDVRRSYTNNINGQQGEDGACIQIGGTTTGANSKFRIVNNTFHDYDRGLLLEPSANDSFLIEGNIFSSRAHASYYEVELQGTATANANNFVHLNRNLYFGTPKFFWPNVNITLATLQLAGEEANAIVGDPLFANAAGGDFTLGAGSPAVDVTTIEFPSGDGAYTAFQNAQGLDIKKDWEGTTRPVDGRWDIGAYEQHIPPHAAPTSLSIP